MALRNISDDQFRNSISVEITTNQYKEYLKYVYGDSWEKPKKNYNWIIDSPSTKDLN